MAIGMEEKRRIVAEVNEAAGSALSAVLADYHGVTVNQMTALRRDARERRVWLRVVRNTLLERAVENTRLECVRGSLAGPTLLALSHEDPGAGARLLRDFAREHGAPKVRALAVDGKLMDAGQLDRLADLPTLDQARSLLMGAMLAPVAGLARALREVPARAARAVAAVRDGKRGPG